MSTPPYNVNTILAWLQGSNFFLDRFTRNAFPYVATTNLLLRNNMHDVEGRRGYLPSSSSVSETQTLGMLGAIRAYRATGHSYWLSKAIGYSESYLTYFCPEPNPPATSNPDTTVWLSHWAVNAANYAVPGKGSQNTQRAFNFGNFDITVNFINGVGIIPYGGTTTGELLADLYRVHSTDGELLYQNVYAPLRSGINYDYSYAVANYRLEGKNFKTDINGVRTLTNEAAGTIVLSGAYANYTGAAKVIYSVWIPENIPPFAKLEPYPMWHYPLRGVNTYLGCAVDSLWWGFDSFAENYAFTGDIKWARAANATRDTTANCARVSNPSFFYKREQGSPFILAGSQAVPVNRSSTGFTASRVNSPGSFQYFLRLDIQSAEVLPPLNYPSFEIQNYIVTVALQSTVSVYVEAASNVTQILEIVFSLSPNTLDTSQEYRAYWLLAGTSTPQAITIGFNSFVKWESGTIWHSLNADNPLYTYGDGDAAITQEQAIIDGRLAIAQVVTINTDEVIGTGFSVANFTNQPPRVKVATSREFTMVIQDSDGDYWKSIVPKSNGAWIDFNPSWGNFKSVDGKSSPGTGNIQSCAFETTRDGVIKLYYAGAAPNTPAQGSTSYKTVLRSRVPTAQILWVGNFYPIGNTNDKLKYNPGVVPFTINVLSDGLGGFVKDSWGGAPYAGYQSPFHWQVWGYPDRANQALQFLNDSQLAYQKQSASGLLAPFIQVFLWKYWDTADFRTYGSEGDEWTWKGADPNTAWFPYCARPMESVARYLMLVPNSNLARRILTRYFLWLQDFLASTNNQPPTDVPPVINPQANYHEPHAAALILRTALYANVAGLLPDVTMEIIERCYSYLGTQYIGSGVMEGSFTAGQPTFVSNGTTYREYFAFWHMEIVSTLAELINYKDKLKYPYLDLIARAGVYPNLVPSSIDEIKLPPFKANRVKFDDGSTQRTLLSQSGVKTEISLKYDFLSPVEVKTLIDFWRLSQGTRIPFTLPSNVLRSPAIIISGINSQGSTTYWRFSEGFNVETEFATSTRGIYNAGIRITSVVN